MEIIYAILIVIAIFCLAIGLSVLIIYLNNKNSRLPNSIGDGEQFASALPSDGNDYESFNLTLNNVKKEYDNVSYNPSNQVYGKEQKRELNEQKAE